MPRWVRWIPLGLVLALALGACARYNNAPVESRASPWHRVAAPTYHIVKRGDTLYEIAWRYRLDYRKLATWNGIREPYLIYPGQRLLLHPPTRSTRAGSAPTHALRKPVSGTRIPPASRVTHASRKPHRLHWVWPARGQVVQRFVAGSRLNQGIHIAGQLGQAIRTAESGKVVYAGSGLRGYGKLIIVKHNNNYFSAYGFNRKLLVKDKQRVARGQRIAEMGKGPDGRPLLHFEIRRAGKPVNPLRLLPR